MAESARFSVETVTTTYGWCIGCGWCLGPVTRPSEGALIAQAATTHATEYPDHEVHLTTNETTTMKHVRWQSNQRAHI